MSKRPQASQRIKIRNKSRIIYRDLEGKFISKAQYEELRKRLQGDLAQTPQGTTEPSSITESNAAAKRKVSPSSEASFTNTVEDTTSKRTRPKESTGTEALHTAGNMRSGGTDIKGQDVKIGGDAVGRDKKSVHKGDIHHFRNLLVNTKPNDFSEKVRAKFLRLLGDNAVRREMQKDIDSERQTGRRLSFNSSNLNDLPLNKMVLHDADFVGAKLRNCKLTQADLRNADFRDADLTQAQLQGAILDGANLSNAIMIDADLSDATLRGTRLHGTNLEDSILNQSDLSEAVASSATSFDRLKWQKRNCLGQICSLSIFEQRSFTMLTYREPIFSMPISAGCTPKAQTFA